MGTRIQKFCDRCKQPIPIGNDRVDEAIAHEFPGQDICPACAQSIYAAGEVARQAALTGKTEKQILSEWIDLYKEPS